MDQQTIQAIAAEVAHHLPSYSWATLAIQIVVIVFAAGVGALGNEFLKTTGKHFATSAQFASLQRELEATTKLVAEVRSNVAQKEWSAREWANLRRLKIEALLEKMNECRAYVVRYQQSALEGKLLRERDPITDLQTTAQLYLPELNAATEAFSNVLRDEIFEAGKLAAKLANVSEENERKQLKFDYGWQTAKTRKSREAESSQALTKAARELLVKIMGPQA